MNATVPGRAFPGAGFTCLASLKGILLCGLIALGGCAELEQHPDPERIEFELAGRIAVRYRDEAASGNLAWRHGRDTDEMLITTPIGSSVARIVRSGGVVVLTASDGTEYRATDAESLTAKALGFRVPLEGLSDWVRGRQVAGTQAQTTRDAQGRLATLEQNGWHVEYQAFRADGLPVRMRLDYPGIELRLAIHEWAKSSSVPLSDSNRPADAAQGTPPK